MSQRTCPNRGRALWARAVLFATLECELIDRRSWQTKTEARLALFTYIESCTTRADATAHSDKSRRQRLRGNTTAQTQTAALKTT